MSEIDQIYDELNKALSQWGLNEIPFSESASTLRTSQLRDVFTGRTQEMREALALFQGRERKRLLVYGWVGIGKTAFILELLGVLRRKSKDTLVTYISLPPDTDLATTALIALARELDDDEWAQHQLNQMGLRPKTRPVKKKGTAKAGISSTGVENEEETVPVNLPKFPVLSFEDLLERALKKYSRVVIAIDDLDKQDPARVRDLLRNAQGMLKGDAWFILSGHPSGLTRDILTREMGLFDLAIELRQFDQPTMYRMLGNYLNSARPKNHRYDSGDPRVVEPFTPNTAKQLCVRSEGVPRWLNRLGSYIMLKAIELNAETITPKILKQGLEYADRQLRGQTGLTPQDYYVLDLVLEKGTLSDEKISLKDLERIKVKEFSEILPILDKLVQLDLVRRLPSDRATEYAPTPMISNKPSN
jgi:type II secretory pathway predicted ATPase ExeA